MPKNTHGGKGARKAKGGEGEERELVFKDADQEYAQIVKKLGGLNVEVLLPNGDKRKAKMRSVLRRKGVWLNAGDIVLISERGYQESVVDVLSKYTPDEERMLRSYGEIEEGAFKPVGVQTDDVEEDVTFGHVDIDDI